MIETSVKDLFMEAIILVMEEAQAAGIDPVELAESRFPRVPFIVLLECLVLWKIEAIDNWWHAVEGIFDDQMVNRAAELIAEANIAEVPTGVVLKFPGDQLP